MDKKFFFQFLVIFIILACSVVFYKTFFNKPDTNLITEVEKDITNQIEIKDSKNNIIENLEYQSIDTLGNRYVIKSKFAEIVSDTDEVLKLKEVTAIIYLINKSPIFINSQNALHNKDTFNTNFFNDVNVKHEDIDIMSNNLDLNYNDGEVSMYNILYAKNTDVEIIADKINFDMLTKDLSINMYDDKKKINIKYK